MSKNPSLDIVAAMQADFGRSDLSAQTETLSEGAANVAPSRRGKRRVTGFVTPHVHKQLRQIALEEETSIEALLLEGLDLVFRGRGKPMIAFDGRERPRSGDR